MAAKRTQNDERYSKSTYISNHNGQGTRRKSVSGTTGHNPKRRGPNPILFRTFSVLLSAAAVLLAFGLVLRGSFSESVPTKSSGSNDVSLSISSDVSSFESSKTSSSTSDKGAGEDTSSETTGKDVSSAKEAAESKGEVSKSAEESKNSSKPSSEETHPAVSSEASGTSSSSKQEESSAPPVSENSKNPGDPYPDLYVEKPEYTPHKPGDKVVYLTFDDGPSDYTLPLLDVLDQYGVKATFFDVGIRTDVAEKAMKETVKRGHVLAVHSYTHDFRSIYQSPNAFLEDFKKERDYIRSVTGVEPTIFRFAGGSINGFNKGTAKSIIKEMERRGYTYYDWNVDSQDATGNNIPTQRIYNNVIQGVKGKDKAIVLMHNTNLKRTTLEILPSIIEELQRMGYRFDVLDNTVEPVQFRVPG